MLHATETALLHDKLAMYREGKVNRKNAHWKKRVLFIHDHAILAVSCLGSWAVPNTSTYKIKAATGSPKIKSITKCITANIVATSIILSQGNLTTASHQNMRGHAYTTNKKWFSRADKRCEIWGFWCRLVVAVAGLNCEYKYPGLCFEEVQ